MNNAEYIASLLARYKTEGAVVDTNLLLLLAIGSYDADRISTFKRTLQYTSLDYELLLRLLARLDRKIVSPNIVTEVDNLSRQLRADEYKAVSKILAALYASSFELYVPAHTAAAEPLYSALGLTDVITLALADQGFLVITDDFALYNRLSSSGRDAININHLRQLLA